MFLDRIVLSEFPRGNLIKIYKSSPGLLIKRFSVITEANKETGATQFKFELKLQLSIEDSYWACFIALHDLRLIISKKSMFLFFPEINDQRVKKSPLGLQRNPKTSLLSDLNQIQTSPDQIYYRKPGSSYLKSGFYTQKAICFCSRHNKFQI